MRARKLNDGALRVCSQAFSCMAEVLIVSLSFIIFTAFDLVDRILCVVFWALDSILDPGSAPCYCKERLNGALPETPLNLAHGVRLNGSGKGGESTGESSLETYVSRSADPPPENTDGIAFATCVSRSADHPLENRDAYESKSGPLQLTCCDVRPLPTMVVSEADSQPSHAENLHCTPCTSLQANHGAHSEHEAEHADCSMCMGKRPFTAEFVHCCCKSRDLSIHNDLGSYGHECSQSGLKNAVLNNASNSCASTIQHLHMVGKVQLSSLQWKRHDSSSPSSITGLDDGNNVPTSLQGSNHFSHRRISRWSDCNCSSCISCQADEEESLYVHIEGKGHENVVFIHGFLSSSLLWSEKVIPHLSKTAKATYRLFAVDLLGFGRSPKPGNCRYTMEDHIKQIEEFVLHRYKIESFHLVAHSMGCLVAIALAAAHVNSVKTITLVAPPYFPAPANEAGASYVLRQVAPRRVWPLTAFGASVMSWYEHLGRGVCFVLCKQHIIWEYVISFLTLNRISRAAVRDFMQHTHHSAWHIFHNVICGEAHAMDGYLNKLERAGCIIHVLHGKDDKVVPARCSYLLKKRYPTLKLQVLDGANHFTIIYGREILFSCTLDRIWRDEGALTKSSRNM